ncbi:MAG: hypothetical protein H7A51_18405 [Akkermansiaceae bacterium]|nr:hypothetical protein [Akkermansiaceae bacterium]
MVTMEKVNSEQKRGNPWLMGGLVGVVLVVLVVIALPVVMKTKGPHHGSSELSNAKQIYYLLIEFDQDYGSFPSDETAEVHKDDPDGDVSYNDHSFKGEFSNDYLGQLIAGGYTKSEELFYARGGATVNKRPDYDVSSWSKVLEAGECGFSYVKNQSATTAGGPILLANMNRNGLSFDPECYNGKGIVLRADGLARFVKVDPKTGIATYDDGKPIFPNAFDRSHLVFPK